ncbi:hypothetical protein ACFQJ7_12125 [Halovenus rubra]|uniref:Uncharacterized protein n=2 Tax=Halovenus rubra TaxID=869890 RepID=A0ACC7E179_9EURY|nr:hypothetical protein [Halovenus rubra]
MTDLFLNYNWNSTEIYHRVTCELLKQTSIDTIGATVVGRKPYKFLKEQNNINYDPLYCVQDVHQNIVENQYDPERISELENRYGAPNLWPALWADRKYIEYTPEKQKRLVQGWFDFFIELFDSFNPDIYLTSAVDSAYTWIPFRIVNEEYGTAVQRAHTRVLDREVLQKTVAGRFNTIWDRYEKMGSDVETVYSESYQEATTFLRKFRKEGVTPEYTDSDSSQTGDPSKLYELVNYWYQKKLGYYNDDFYHDSTQRRIKESVKQLLWRKYVDYRDLFQRPNYNSNYVYFPLHLQPEASTMVKAPMYVELPDVIRDLSKSLPVDYNLYVKEHPALYKYKIRRPRYYKEIDKLPNTVLIHPHVDSHELIKSSDAVTTVTGTAGLEGVFYKKPVLTFGEPNYSKLPQVYEAGDPKGLPAVLYDALSEHRHTDEYESELIKYLTAIFHESYPSLNNKSGERLQDAIQKQCSVLEQELFR